MWNQADNFRSPHVTDLVQVKALSRHYLPMGLRPPCRLQQLNQCLLSVFFSMSDNSFRTWQEVSVSVRDMWQAYNHWRFRAQWGRRGLLDARRRYAQFEHAPGKHANNGFLTRSELWRPPPKPVL